jgi:putative endonuclease
MYVVYIVECRDGSLYTGITTNIHRRIREHNESSRGASYTRSRRPVVLRFSRCVSNRSAALQLEIDIKRLRRFEKMLLIKTPR